MSPSFQAAMDYREEGCFRPSQYPAGSKEQNEYLAAQHQIEQREAEENEHYIADIRQERNRQERITS